MRAALILVFVALATAAIAPSTQFARFQQRFGRRYATAEERQARYEIFRQNLAEAERLNALNDGATYGITPYIDLTREEFVQKFLSAPRPARENVPMMARKKSYSYPVSWDWRAHGAVYPPGAQGDCGSCWAWSATSNAESVWAVAGHNIEKFAVQQLISCDSANDACEGGFAYKGLEYIVKNGIETEKDYPYEEAKGTCKYDRNRVAASFSSWKRIPNTDDALAEFLATTSPATMAVYASFKWQLYTGGIFTSSVCNINSFNHEVGVVGYGEENGKQFWIVKNSWGPDWGEQGYIRLDRGTGNNCNAIDCSSLIV